MGKIGWNIRIKKFSLLDEKLAQFAAVFGTLIAIKLVPEILDVGLEWSIPLCIACAIKPLYVFWIKKA